MREFAAYEGSNVVEPFGHCRSTSIQLALK
jgi:hypothetical protein